jgi:hypothetical protein
VRVTWKKPSPRIINQVNKRRERKRVLRINLALLLLFDLEQQRTVDTRQDTAKRDRGPDQGVEFFVAADGELQVARCDTLDFEVLSGVACQLEDFGG